MSLVSIADAVRCGRASAVEILSSYLEQIERLNGELNAFVYVDAEAALQCARDIDRMVLEGKDPGPLAGVPIGVKDMEDCIGMPTRQGSMLITDTAPKRADSIHVGRLRAAGAICVGKTATAEFGMDSATFTQLAGVTRNPWNPELTSGGSSGGSATAVAAGMVPLATGTDAGGSIRQPAAYTGLVGLKPSHGRIPKNGGFSNFSTHGALSVDVRGTARYLDVVAGPDDRDRQSLPASAVSFEHACDNLLVAGLRVAYSPDIGYAVVEPEIETIARNAAEQLISLAGLRHVDMPVVLTNIHDAWGGILLGKLHQDWVRDGVWPARAGLLSANVHGLMERIEQNLPLDFDALWQQIYQLERDMAALFQHIDVLLTPATACRPYRADSTVPHNIDGIDISHIGVEPFGAFVNACWNPAISIPAGLSSDGLPVGLQITARRHRDDVALRLARLFEQTYPWSFPWNMH